MARVALRGLVFALMALAAGLLVAGAARATAPAKPEVPSKPTGPVKIGAPSSTQDAFVHFRYEGAETHEITVTRGVSFTLDMYLNAGSNPDASAQQTYLGFSYQLLQVVQTGVEGCSPSSEVNPDPSSFDFVLQNEVCNSPGCDFRGVRVPPGSIAFASGGLTNCYSGCGGDFPIAQVALCGTRPGRAVLHWQFHPPYPLFRDSEIVAFSNDLIQNPESYKDLIVNIVDVGIPTATATPCTMPITDVEPGDYYYEAVRYLYCQGAITGYVDGTFRPANDTTRAQLCKIMTLANGWTIDTEGGPHFTDVPNSDPFYPYIETAYNYSAIDGYNDSTFHPASSVTRGQLSKIVSLGEGWALSNPSIATFGDVPVGSPFFPYVEAAYCHGVISGYAGGTFKPQNYATRGQVSKIIYRALLAPGPCE